MVVNGFSNFSEFLGRAAEICERNSERAGCKKRITFRFSERYVVLKATIRVGKQRTLS